MATWRGSARRLRASVDVVMHGTTGLTGELERRSAALEGEVGQLRGQVEALQTMTVWLDDIRNEVANLAGPGGKLVAAGSPWWSLLPFTTHRIELAPGLFTADTGVQPNNDLRVKAVLDASGGLAGRRVVDVGCLEGGFSVEFARHGAAEVVGIDARELSVRRCDMVRDLLQLDNLRFVCGDVLHELARAQQPYDVVFATGILYHLAHPDVALRLMRDCCSGFMLLCTHVANADASTHGCSDELIDYVGAQGTYRGRWYGERGINPEADSAGGDLWASWSNETSFWPLEDDLVRMIHAAGFRSIEKVEPSEHPEPWQVDHMNRVIYVCRI